MSASDLDHRVKVMTRFYLRSRGLPDSFTEKVEATIRRIGIDRRIDPDGVADFPAVDRALKSVLVPEGVR